MNSQSGDDSSDATPGRPKESGSRQQTRPDQTSHSGSPEFDRKQKPGGADLPKPDREN